VRVLSQVLTYGSHPESQWGLAFYTRKLLAPLIYHHLLHKHLSTAQLYEHLGPERMVKQIVKHLRPRLDTIIDETMEQNHDIFWENLPITVKNRFYGRAHKILPNVIDNVVEDIGDNIDRLATLEEISFHNLLESPSAVPKIVRQLDENQGAKKTILGILTGYTLGLLVLISWLVAEHWSVLVLGYCVVSICCFWVIHHASTRPSTNPDVISQLLSTYALAPIPSLKFLLTEGRSRFARNLIKKHATPIIDRATLRTFTQLTIGPSGYANVKQQLSHNLYREYFSAIKEDRFVETQRLQLEHHLSKTVVLSEANTSAILDTLRKTQNQFLLPVSLLVGSFSGLSLYFLIRSLG